MPCRFCDDFFADGLPTPVSFPRRWESSMLDALLEGGEPDLSVGPLLPLREKVDRPKAETDEGYLSAISEVETTPHPPFGHLLPQGEKEDTERLAAAVKPPDG